MTAFRIPTPISITQEDDCTTFTLQVTDQLIYFPGHFPAHSILPGVAILDWVIDLARQHMGLTIATPLTMEVIKFKQVIEESCTVTLHIKHLVEKNKLSYTLNSAAGEHSSGRIRLIENRGNNNSSKQKINV